MPERKRFGVNHTFEYIYAEPWDEYITPHFQNVGKEEAELLVGGIVDFHTSEELHVASLRLLSLMNVLELMKS